MQHSSLTLAYESGAEALTLKDRGGHPNIDTTRCYYVRPKGNRNAETARDTNALLAPKNDKHETLVFKIYADAIVRF